MYGDKLRIQVRRITAKIKTTTFLTEILTSLTPFWIFTVMIFYIFQVMYVVDYGIRSYVTGDYQ
jgi:hypothetical protein